MISEGMGDSQDLSGNGRGDGVDVANACLGLVVDRDLHRPFRHGGEINGNRPRPCKPDEAGQIQPPAQGAHPARFIQVVRMVSVSGLEDGHKVEPVDALDARQAPKRRAATITIALART